MSDLISRKAAIDAFYQYPNVNWTTLDVMEKINEVPSVQPEHGRWIPCSERLPEKHGYYVVQTDGSRNHVIDIAEYGLFWHNMKQEMMWNKASKILAWMPLPKPYMIDEEG